MSAHPAPRATRPIRAETAGSSGLALGPNQRGKGGGEVEASIPVMAMAHQRTRGRVRRRARRNLAGAEPSFERGTRNPDVIGALEGTCALLPRGVRVAGVHGFHGLVE